MSWTYILALAAIVFFNRSFFLEPQVNVRLFPFFEKMLKYSAPCLLTAICAPIIFYQEGVLRPWLDNTYLYGAIFCTVMMLLVRRVLLSMILSLIFFYILTFILH